jgi:peptidoglycan/LPS O-acetylase OafA/YrhL
MASAAVQTTSPINRREAGSNASAPLDQGRLPQLDALRGLAALTVVFHHFECLLRPSHESTGLLKNAFLRLLHGGDFHSFAQTVGFTRLLDLTPLYLLVAGHEPVVLFFVLSGFVLALPFYRGHAVTYNAFLTKRVFRIYIPYLVAIFLAIFLNATISRGGIPSLNEWFNQTWRLPVTAGEIGQHFVFLGTYDCYQFNTAIWSLVHEMRISLVFPAIILIAGLPLPLALPVLGLLSIGGTFFNNMLAASEIGYFASVHYCALFGIGALIAKNRAVLSRAYTNSGRIARTSLVLMGFLLYLYGRFFAFSMLAVSGDEATGAGAGILVITALASVKARNLLAPPWCAFLGRVSYSLYLVHGTVLFSLVHLLYPIVPWPVIAILYILMALVGAQLCYRLVEVPSIQAGKLLSLRSG